MKRRYLVLVLLSLVASANYNPVNSAAKNPETFVAAIYGNVNTLDPAVCYDTRSDELLRNIYQNLICYDGASTSKYLPALATEVPTTANGGISKDGLTYTFTVRKNAKCHGGEVLTAEDVVYCIKRVMVTDADGGPSWMMLEAMVGVGCTRDDSGKVINGIFDKIDKSVEAKGDKVIFHLPKPYPPFIQILIHNIGCIYPKSWAVANKAWDGSMATAPQFNNPAAGKEQLQTITNGSGPYQMKQMTDPNNQELTRFENYTGGPKPKIKTAIWKNISEWSTRKLMLQNGDADYVQVDDQYLSEARQIKGVKEYKGPQLSVDFACMVQKLEPTANPNIGSGKLDGQGIPIDFFADINVRKAFNYCFNSDQYKKDVFNGDVIIPTSPVIEGLPFHKEVPSYKYDLKKAEELFKKAYNGQLWEKGFYMVLAYNTGNQTREAAANILAENIRKVNKKFNIEVRAVEWKDILNEYKVFKYPIFIVGWVADYPDPHNFVYTYMHSKGAYGAFLAYKNQEADKLCEEGIQTLDPKKREEIYAKLQNIFYADATTIPLSQRIGKYFYRDWVKGFVANPIFPYYNFVFRYSKQ